MKKFSIAILATILLSQVVLAASSSLEGALVYVKTPNVSKPDFLSMEVKPGGSASDYLILENVSDAPQEILLYKFDSFINAEGKKTFKSPSEDQTEFGKWASFDKDDVVLQPKEKAEIKVTITIPAGTPEKEYTGGVGIKKKVDESTPGMHFAIIASNPVYFKVTSNPQPIERIPSPPLITPSQTYLYISAGLFVVILAWFIRNSLQEKKRRKSS